MASRKNNTPLRKTCPGTLETETLHSKSEQIINGTVSSIIFLLGNLGGGVTAKIQNRLFGNILKLS